MSKAHRWILGGTLGKRFVVAHDMSPTARRLQHERCGTILDVADSDLRRLVSDTLAEAGYCVVTIGNSVDAVAFLRRQTTLPALILLYWFVPGMSGLQFIALHASSPTFSHAPVAVIAEPTANNIPRLCV